MKTFTYLKIVSIILIIGLTFIYILSQFDRAENSCSKYYVMECQSYNFFDEICNCEGQELFLNNTMIAERNKIMKGFNTGARLTEFNFSKLNKSLFVR